MRVLDADHQGLAPRVHSDWTVAAASDALVKALEATQQDVPLWLRAFRDEHRSRRRGTMTETFAMHCFWEGEAALGALPGVVRTRAGWLDGREVVDVEFDPAMLPYRTLLHHAERMECTSHVYVRHDQLMPAARQLVGDRAKAASDATRTDKEPKYRLGPTPLRHVPMTTLQAARIDAAQTTLQAARIDAARQPDPAGARRWLSPRQLDLLATISAHPQRPWPVVVDEPFLQAWGRIRDVFMASSRGGSTPPPHNR